MASFIAELFISIHNMRCIKLESFSSLCCMIYCIEILIGISLVLIISCGSSAL